MEQTNAPRKKGGLKLSPATVLMAVLAIFVLSTISTSFYSVDEGEQAVVTRLGKYYKTVGSGLQFKIPFGIDKNYNVSIRSRTEQFGYNTGSGNQNQYGNNSASESIMLTGDLNIIDIEWVIQYRIVNPSNWLFNVQDRAGTIRDISQSVINALVGDRAILDVMGSERTAIEIAALDAMNENFDQLGLGISVEGVRLQNIVPPANVQDAFEDVNRAEQDAERYINEGKEAYNKEIPLAQGIANQQIQIAEGYAIERVNQAVGDVERFSAIYGAYTESPTVTRDRLYIETMEEIFSAKENTTLIDGELDNVLPVKTLTGQTATQGAN